MDEHPHYRVPPFTVDAIVEYDGKLLLIERGKDPFKGLYALPGGHVDKAELPEAAVVREVAEETGIDVQVTTDLGDYSHVIDDPRYDAHEFKHRAYVCETEDDHLDAGDDAARAEWVDLVDLPDELAFGHETIIQDYLTGSHND